MPLPLRKACHKLLIWAPLVPHAGHPLWPPIHAGLSRGSGGQGQRVVDSNWYLLRGGGLVCVRETCHRPPVEPPVQVSVQVTPIRRF